jgi:flavin-dependent dehydrogenase
MEPEDFLEPEVAITAVVVAAIFSPRARRVLRRGAVYGMAGVLMAGDAIASFARSVGQGVRQAGASAANAAQNAANQVKTDASTPEAALAGTAQKRTTQKSTTAKTTPESAGGQPS